MYNDILHVVIDSVIVFSNIVPVTLSIDKPVYSKEVFKIQAFFFFKELDFVKVYSMSFITLQREYSSMVEQQAFNLLVIGSNPIILKYRNNKSS